jgi:Lrp/AsnC family leucine-responsive transcriptional regulator
MRVTRAAEKHYKLDDVDRKLIAILKSNGRATSREIAKSLKMVATTVSARIKRLERMRALRVVAVTDFSALGYKLLLAVGIQVQGRPAEDVARELAVYPEIFALHLVTGSRDIECLVGLRDFDDMHTFLSKHLAKVRGIRRLEAGIAADILKYNFDVAHVYS